MAKAGLHLTAQCAWCGQDYRQSRSDQRFCSQRCGIRGWRKIHRKAVQQKLGLWRVGRVRHGGPGKSWSKGKRYVPRPACLVCGKEFYTAPCYKKRGPMNGKFCSAACRIKGMPPIRSTYKAGRRPDIGPQYFRSQWEANYARYLEWMRNRSEIVAWEYEAETFWFEKIKRGCRSYLPDFKVTTKHGTTEYHEIKGWMDAKSATKLKRMAIYHPTVKMVVIDSKFYADLKKNLSRIIPGWEA